MPFCGTSIQAVTKNIIVGPTTLGFLPITGTGSILAILLSKNFNYSNGIYYQYLFTILLTIFVIIILFIGSIFKENRKNLVVLFGLFIGIVFSAFNSLMMFLYPQDINISPWLGQTNYIYSWQKFYISLSMIIIGMIFILINFRQINILQKNEDLSKSLGVNVNKVFWFSFIGSILISTTVSYLIGSLIAISIIIPYLVRRILGKNDFLTVSILSSFLTMIFLSFSGMMNSIYSYGLNLFCIPILSPIFIFVIWNRRDI